MPNNTPTHITVPDSSIERLRAVWIHRLLSLAAPWAVAAVVAFGAARAHGAWSGPGQLPRVLGLAVATVIVTATAWFATRHHGALLRLHSAATAAAGGGWLCLVVATGPGASGTAYLGVVLAVTLCLTWNVRRAHRPASAPADTTAARITDLFDDAAAPAGVKGAKMTVREVGARKIRGLVRLVPGEQTAADVVRRTTNIESGMKLPPGSLTASEHMDRADLAEVTLTDPRLMRKPIPYPGPSRPGASIAEPIVVGLWQDADPVEWTITGHHVQQMGMTGAGKGFGGAWSYLGEVITREDVAVFAADITKGDQTLGPLRVALHDLADDLPKARALLADMRSIVRPRTDYLASRGLQRWARGCGLSYLVLWLEECPDILDVLSEKQMEAFVSLVKAMRSAGMTVGMSLQRSTYDQMPTILRGQLANWCFGVANSADGKYGLSERQEEGGAAPERWQNSQPGMAYLDAPGIPEDRIAMPMRCWFWGDDASVMAAHAARFPASARPLDDLTARLLADAAAARLAASPRRLAAPRPAPDDEDQEDEDTPPGQRLQKNALEISAEENDQDEDQEDDPETVRAEYLTEPDPDPELSAAIDDPIEAPADDDVFGALEFPPGGKSDPAQARARFRAQLAEWLDEGRQEFATADLYELLSTVGLGRGWLHKQINAAIEDGLIEPVVDAEKGRFGRYELCEPETADVA
ncbi:MAG: hypothetical protein ACR2MP_07235 [Streptosporangiaceae bacterium]